MSKQFENMQKLAFGKVVTSSPEPLNENTLRDKIKELVHSSLGEAKKKKKDEETDIAPQEDAPMDKPTDSLEPTDAGADIDMSGEDTDTGIDIDPKVKNIQNLLQKAYANAKSLGDEKLMTQIGNTITMVVRNQVLGGQVAESLDESILKIYHYDPSSLKLIDVDTQSYSSEEEAKMAALAHNWQIAYDNGDTDLSKEEYIQSHSWDDLDNISYENYGYEIVAESLNEIQANQAMVAKYLNMLNNILMDYAAGDVYDLVNLEAAVDMFHNKLKREIADSI